MPSASPAASPLRAARRDTGERQFQGVRGATHCGAGAAQFDSAAADLEPAQCQEAAACLAVKPRAAVRLGSTRASARPGLRARSTPSMRRPRLREA